MTLNMSPGWMSDALCAETDPNLFVPPKGGTPEPARRICDSCDVVAQCLEYALVNNFRVGLYGALTARERAPLHRERERSRLRRDAA